MHAEFIHRARIDRDGREVLGHCLVAQTLLNPAACHARIGLRLERDEGLGADDEERARGIGLGDDVGELAAIDIGDEGHAGCALRHRLQRFHCHRRAEIGTADADVDHQGKGRIGAGADAALAHVLGKFEHALALGHHLRVDIRSIDHERRRPPASQRSMQHRTIFRGVDVIAPEHRLDARSQIELVGE